MCKFLNKIYHSEKYLLSVWRRIAQKIFFSQAKHVHPSDTEKHRDGFSFTSHALVAETKPYPWYVSMSAQKLQQTHIHKLTDKYALRRITFSKSEDTKMILGVWPGTGQPEKSHTGNIQLKGNVRRLPCRREKPLQCCLTGRRDPEVWCGPGLASPPSAWGNLSACLWRNTLWSVGLCVGRDGHAARGSGDTRLQWVCPYIQIIHIYSLFCLVHIRRLRAWMQTCALHV